MDSTHAALKSVYYKTGKLNNLFRTPELELIAGVEGPEVFVKEEQCRFKLDVRSVYYCSRLHTERSRVLGQIEPEALVFDAFCGVGPFALQSARARKCVTFANDLNPACLYYFRQNQVANKVQGRSLGFHSDARQFLKLALQVSALLALPSNCQSVETLKLLVSEYNLNHNLSGQQLFINNWEVLLPEVVRVAQKKRFYVYMNLPGENIDFLDALDLNLAAGILKKEEKFAFNLEFFVTCFEDIADSPEKVFNAAKKRIIGRISEPNRHSQVSWKVEFKESKEIKNVSSSKTMLCVHFVLQVAQKKSHPASLLGAHEMQTSSLNQSTKKVKTF